MLVFDSKLCYVIDAKVPQVMFYDLCHYCERVKFSCPGTLFY